jgi:hypothetical protein
MSIRQQSGVRLRKYKYFVESNEKGQATAEYILLLAIVVLLALSSLYQLNGAFKNFVTNYFGNYIACLLETGELPAMGVSGQKGEGVCDEEHEAFDISKGRPLKVDSGNDNGGGGGGSSGGGSGPTDGNVGSTTGGAGNNQDLRRKNSSVTTNENGGASGGNSGGGGGISRGGTFDVESSNRTSLTGGASDTDSEEGAYTGSNASVALGAGNSNRSGESLQRTPLKSGFRLEEEEAEKSKDRPRRTSLEKMENDSLRPGRTKVSVDDTKEGKKPRDDDEPMTFSGFLRLLFAAAIIIAILLLVGGQLMQISKNMEGGDR